MVRSALGFAFASVFLLAPRLASASPADAPILPLCIVGATEPRAAAGSKLTLPPSSSSDSLVQIGEFYPVLWEFAALGDTDHDYRNEIVVAVNDDLEYTYRVLENQGNDVYVETYHSTDYLIPSAIADLNSNGREEIVGQYSSYLRVYESPDRSSHPSQLLWSSPPLSNWIGQPTVGDTDRDGRLEIIHSVNGGGNWLVIYEWSWALNTFVSVYDALVDAGQQAGPKVLADFDGDGLIEIALGGTRGRLHILESPADDTWVETFVDSTPLFNAYGIAGGEDTDGNGRPEIFFQGNQDGGAVFLDVTYVYEATGDNQFAPVDTLTMPGALGGHFNALADLRGPGSSYYVCLNGALGLTRLLFFEAAAPGSWVLVEDYPHSHPFVNFVPFDANHNGRDEIFWMSPGALQTGAHSIILEVPLDPSSVDVAPGLGPLRVTPNPCRLEASISLPTSTHAAHLAVYDVAGRLVDRRVVAPSAGAHVLWPARFFNAGIYLLSLEDPRGSTLATGRVVVR